MKKIVLLLCAVIAAASMFSGCVLGFSPDGDGGGKTKNPSGQTTDGGNNPSGQTEGESLSAVESFLAPLSWYDEAAIRAEIKPEYIDSVLVAINASTVACGAGASDWRSYDVFKPFEFKAVLVTQRTKESLQLLVMLHNDTAEYRQSAIEKLLSDERVLSAGPFSGTPFETRSTLAFSPQRHELQNGEGSRTTLELTGDFFYYLPPFDTETVYVTLKNYDAGKIYSPADFPSLKIEQVKHAGNSFSLTLAKGGYNSPAMALANPGYFNVIKAVHALALDPQIEYVTPIYVDYDRAPPVWKISDPEIAEFELKAILTEAERETVSGAGWDGYAPAYYLAGNGYSQATILGKKPGKVTVSYIPWRGSAEFEAEWAITCTIDVTGGDLYDELPFDTNFTPYSMYLSCNPGYAKTPEQWLVDLADGSVASVTEGAMTYVIGSYVYAYMAVFSGASFTVWSGIWNDYMPGGGWPVTADGQRASIFPIKLCGVPENLTDIAVSAVVITGAGTAQVPFSQSYRSAAEIDFRPAVPFRFDGDYAMYVLVKAGSQLQIFRFTGTVFSTY
ncbi:MAG: hypothetical protein FWD58_00415 [Firmicutes bacterium]|nr:hypothetical protein [Bacillota bacterium]